MFYTQDDAGRITGVADYDFDPGKTKQTKAKCLRTPCGQLYLEGTPPPPTRFSKEEAYQVKSDEIQGKFNSAIKALNDIYSPEEQSTWALVYPELMQIAKGEKGDSPLVDSAFTTLPKLYKSKAAFAKAKLQTITQVKAYLGTLISLRDMARKDLEDLSALGTTTADHLLDLPIAYPAPPKAD